MQGKTVRVRNDHDETTAGPTQPMISVRCLDDKQEVIEILESCRQRHEDIEIPDEPDEESSATARRNFKKNLSGEDRSKYALKHPRDDNYLTKNALLARIYKKLGWKPVVDVFCTPGGGNATGPFYYDAESDAFHQAEHLAGLDLMCNPAFDCSERCINLLVEAYRLQDTTRAVLIVPERRSKQWFQDLVKNKLFRLVFYWTKNMGVFSRANKQDSLAKDGRINYSTGFDNILVFELNKEAPPY